MYYFSYIKRFESDEVGKIANELYKLSSVQMYKGEIVHKAIENYIQNTLCGAKFNLAHAIKVATTRIDKISTEKNTIEQTNGAFISEEFLNKVKNEITKCLRAFESLWPTISAYQNISIEKYDSFNYRDVNIIVKPDYIIRDGQKIKIFDWKTGSKKNDDFYQSMVYCMYAINKFNLSEKDVSVELVYLSDCQKYNVTPENKHMENMKKRIIIENDEMSLLDQIPEENITNHCIFCKYYTICAHKGYSKTTEKITV